MRVIIDGWAWLERGALSEGNLRALRTALTVQPILTTDVAGVAAPKPIMLYRDRPEEGLFGVPRGFYRASAKGQNEEVLKVSYGQPMQPMVSRYRADGPFAQQVEALDIFQHQLTAQPWGGGILCAGCGVGKSTWSVELAHRLGRTTLIVVHKEFFLDQWRQRILEVLPAARIGIVRQNECNFRDQDFVIAMIQSLAKDTESQRYSRELYNAFNLCVYDEMHHTGSEVWSTVSHRFNAAYRIGLSATPRRADRAEAVFFHHIGPILHTMQAQSMPFQVRYLTSDSELQGIRRGDYSVSAGRMNSAQVITALANDEARTRHIAEDVAIATRKGRKIMIVSHRLEHLRAMRKDLRKVLAATLLPWPVAIEPYTGQWFSSEGSDDKRTLTKGELRAAERANVMLCTIQLVNEGLDVPALDVIVIATPLGDIEQVAGRGRRWCTPSPEKCAHYCPWRAGTCQGKLTPILVDVRDPEVAWSERKARGRDKFYRRMGVALPGEEAQGCLAVDKPPVVG
jgi:superfamily II DNA or RNA helicase